MPNWLILLMMGFATLCHASSPEAFEIFSNGKLELSNTNSLVELYAVTPTVKVFAQNDAGLTNAPLVDKLYFHAARNETEQMQLVIKPLLDLDEVNLSFELTSGSMTIPQSAWKWYRVKEVYCEKATYWFAVWGNETGLVPDPLMSGEPFDAVGGSNAVILLNLQVGSDWPAGLYHGSINIVADGVEIATIPVELTVWPITLPSERTLAVVAPNLTSNGSDAQQMKQFGVTHAKYGAQGLIINYDSDAGTLSIDTSEYENSMKQWIDQAGLKSIALPPKLLGTMALLSDNYLGIGIAVGSDEFWAVFEQFMTQMATFYRTHGWENNVVWYMMDEIYPEHYSLVASIAKRAKEIFPELTILLVTDEMPDSLSENMDVWVVPWHFFATQDDDWKRWNVLRERGVSMYAYMNSLYFINAEHSLRSMRFFPSVLAKYGYEGCLWWGMTVYQFSGGQGNPWETGITSISKSKWNTFGSGNGYLIYPPTASHSEFSSSLRWENFKQGIDEYEMLGILLKKYQEIETTLGSEKGTADKLIRYWGGLLSDGFRLQAYRKEGQYIERFRKLLASEIITATNTPLVLADVAFDDTRNIFIIQGTCQTGTVITVNGVTPYQSSSEGMVKFAINLPSSSVTNVITIVADDGTGNSKTLWREGVMMRPSMFSAFSATGDFIAEDLNTLPLSRRHKVDGDFMGQQ